MISRHQFVYPGHPLTIALFILDKHPSFEHAISKGHSYPKALENNDVPGAGGCVYSALDFLKVALTQSFDEAVAFARKRWAGECESVFKDRLIPGQEQADSLQELVRKKLRDWNYVYAKSTHPASKSRQEA